MARRRWIWPRARGGTGTRAYACLSLNGRRDSETSPRCRPLRRAPQGWRNSSAEGVAVGGRRRPHLRDQRPRSLRRNVPCPALSDYRIVIGKDGTNIPDSPKHLMVRVSAKGAKCNAWGNDPRNG